MTRFSEVMDRPCGLTSLGGGDRRPPRSDKVTTDYNAIAEGYKRAKLQLRREFIEVFTFLDLIGDVSGKAVVDLACGEGFYTRRLIMFWFTAFYPQPSCNSLCPHRHSYVPIGIRPRGQMASVVALANLSCHFDVRTGLGSSPGYTCLVGWGFLNCLFPPC
jgi:hypothetical protein